MAEQQQGNDPGVRKYFFYIKEKVSADWKDLAFHLAFERSDTDNIVGRNRDDKSCCMDLLEEWLKRNGERATIEVLMQALSKAELRSTVDGLKRDYPELRGPQTSISQRKRKKKKQRKAESMFRESLKNYYELKLATFKPLIWNDNFTLPLSDIFTELELKHTGGKRRDFQKGLFRSGEGKQTKKLSSSDDLFNQTVTGRSTAPRCILIEGEAGGGKTTFLSKEALDAVSQKTELGKRHDIVLLIRLREVREGETIEEIVWDQCVPETTEGVNLQCIRATLQRNESRVLFLLDGYDELLHGARAKTQAIPKLLSGKTYPKSTIMITSRPSAGVQQYTQPDCQVNIVGFSPKNVKKYVKQYFCITQQAEELAQELIRAIEGNQLVTDLIHTPIFLALVCLIWEEDPEMVSPGTMTGLYNDLLMCLIEKYCKREGVDMPTEGLPKDVADSLLQLGKLALEALLRNETLLDLTEEERENVNWDLLSKLGVVSLEVSASKRHPRKQLNFSHKTMQEFLAGRYVALTSQGNVELLRLTSVTKVFEHGNLLQFTCGCDSRAAQAVMKELCELSNKEFKDLARQADQLGELHWKSPAKPEVEKSAIIYSRFVLLCLDILNERKEQDVLHAVSRALPVMIINVYRHTRQHAALQYYLKNIQSADLPDRMILGISYGQVHDELSQFLENSFTRPIPDLRLDLKLIGVPLGSPDQTAKLVSILKNVPGLRALELLQTGLTPSSLQSLVQGFTHIPLLEKLGLSHNPALGDLGIEILRDGLSSVPHLQLAVLRLDGVGMTAVGMSSLAPYMAEHLSGLRELNISGNNIESGLESLTNVLHNFPAMQVLHLYAICITATGMRTLVPALHHLTRLINLSIRDNNIGDDGLKLLAEILPHLTGMKVLVLMNTNVGDKGMLALVKALPHLVKLQVLDVSGNNIGDSGIVSLVETLCQPSSLDMEQSPSGEKSLTTAPTQHYNTTLRVLRIGFNRGVTGVGLDRVAQLVSSLPALTGLGMSGSLAQPARLSVNAAKALAKALPRLPDLEWLYLQGISMELAGFQAVAQVAAEHPTLQTLVYSRSRVPEGADTSASCLRLF